MQPKPGDKVRVTTVDGVFEGALLPRPTLLSDDITVLKLKTGYNIGLESKMIKKIEVLEEYRSPVQRTPKILLDKTLPTIAILSTGGTIASRIDYRTGGVYADYSAEDFVAMCPELAKIANIKAIKVMSMMSEDALATDWELMAKEVQKVLASVDGVVITHGTDTMHYTSAALSFLLKGLNKPIIITGAQRSIDRGSSDAFMNLICAVTAAAKWDGACVAICMHGSMSDDVCVLLRGTKVRKMHSSRRDAFRAINDGPLANISVDGSIEVTNSDYPKRSGSKVSLRRLNTSVALIHLYPNMDPGIIDYHVKKGVKGLVLAATGLGNVPMHNALSVLPALKKAKKAGIPIVICGQTIYGRVNPYVYSNMRTLSLELGAQYMRDALPEVAYVKLMVALEEKDPIAFLHENVAGEFTERELDDSFLR